MNGASTAERRRGYGGRRRARSVRAIPYNDGVSFPLAQFERFAQAATVPNKDAGWFHPWPLFGGQRYALNAMARGFDEGIHEFVILAGRQMGKTTLFDLLDCFWPQKYPGVTGILVSDVDDNRDYRRDVIVQMHGRLPVLWRYPMRLNNQLQIAWDNGSRLLFDAVGSRVNKSFGRSRGINYVHGDEVGAWPNQRAAESLRPALSASYPHRLYGWASTAQGDNVFRAMWNEAQASATKRAIFLGWFLDHRYAVPRERREIWDHYGRDRLTDDERVWVAAVQRAFDYDIGPEQWVWYRWVLDDQFYGDEDMRQQEFPCVPEDAWVAFGDKFFRPAMIRGLRQGLADIRGPDGYRYEWGPTMEETTLHPCGPDEGTLRVWEEPDPGGVYLVAAHPAYSSTPTARDDVIDVWRAYPDPRLVQVAQYCVPGGDHTRRFTWAVCHLAGAYRQQRQRAEIYLALEMQGTGRAVFDEMQRIEQIGYGLGPSYHQRGRELADVIGAVRHYIFRRPDSFSASGAYHWQTQANFVPWFMNQLRDEIASGHMEIRSPETIDELAMVRRTEDDGDEIQGGGSASDCRVKAAGLAVRHFLEAVVHEISGYIAPKETSRGERHVGEQLVGGFLRGLAEIGRPR